MKRRLMSISSSTATIIVLVCAALVPLSASAVTGNLESTWGVAGSAANDQFNHAYGIAVSQGKFYVADYGNQRIGVFQQDSANPPVVTWLSNIDTTLGGGSTFPTKVAVDASGRVYVLAQDTQPVVTYQIKRFTSAGAIDPGWTIPSWTGNTHPLAIAVNPVSNNLWVGVYRAGTQPQIINEYDGSGAPTGTSRTFSYSCTISAPGTGVEADDLTFDSSGNLYIPHHQTNFVSKMDPSGAEILQFGCSSPFGDIIIPTAVAIDGSGNVFVAIAGGSPFAAPKIVMYDSAASQITSFSANGIDTPGPQVLYGLAVWDVQNVLWATQYNDTPTVHQIQIYEAAFVPTPTPVSGGRTQQGTLVVQKIIDGEHAGIDPDIFTFTLNGEQDRWNESGINEYIRPPGAYVVHEDPTPGYTVTYGGDCSPSGSVELESGTKTCIVTNTATTTTLPSASPVPTPTPTPAPLAQSGIIINNGAESTRSRIVDLDLKSPFTSGNVTMRIADGDELTANDRDLLASIHASASATGEIASPSLSNNELQSGVVVPYDPVRNGWDLCRGPSTCTPGVYHVYAQFTQTVSASGSAASLGDVISPVYEDDIVYTPPSPSPTPVPTTTPPPTPSPTPIPIQSPPVPPPATPPPVQPSVPASPTVHPPVPTPGPSPSVLLLHEGARIAPAIFAVLAAIPAMAAAAAAAAAPILAYALQRFLTVIGLKRRRRIWGTVYDARTKHPIPFAKVQLLDTASRVLETRIADRDGRYGFLVSPSGLQAQTISVRIMPVVQGYTFPSVLVVAGAADSLVYDRVYTGGFLTIGPDQIVNADVPLDPVGEQHPWTTSLPRLFGGLTTRTLGVFFWVGCVVIPISIWLDPSRFNIGAALVFVVSNAFILFTEAYRPYGTVTDTLTGHPMPFTLITLSDPSGRRVAFTVSDERGRYFMLAEQGTYELTAYTSAAVIPPRQGRFPLISHRGWITRPLAF